MESATKSSNNSHQSCCQHNKSICESEMTHLINTIKQRYISPYKIIYMINQQEADYFKLRNKGMGCCSSSLITIPIEQMTKTELYLFEAINESLKLKNLDNILQQLAEKFENIVKSGQKENLKVDDQVEKFLMEKTLSEGFNLHLYKIVTSRLKRQTQAISSSAMLWATPNTWYAKYPNTPLHFLSSQSLSALNESKKGYAFEQNFLTEYKDNLLKELKLLEQDGKFEEQIWLKQVTKFRNDTKVLNGLERFCYDGTQESYTQGQIAYPYFKRSLLTLRSIPFELNAKLNAFCTLSENNQINFFKKSLIYKFKDEIKVSRYSTFCLIGEGKIKCTINSKRSSENTEQRFLKSGQLILIDNELCEIELQGQCENLFLFRSWISTLAKKS